MVTRLPWSQGYSSDDFRLLGTSCGPLFIHATYFFLPGALRRALKHCDRLIPGCKPGGLSAEVTFAHRSAGFRGIQSKGPISLYNRGSLPGYVSTPEGLHFMLWNLRVFLLHARLSSTLGGHIPAASDLL